MDLFYGKLSNKGKAKMDIFTSFFLIFYLIITISLGSITSLIYTIETKQKLFTAWAPYVWPIKTSNVDWNFINVASSVFNFI